MNVLTVAEQVSVRVYMSLNKRQKFKALAALKGRDMSDIANELIDKWLMENDLQPAQQEQGK
jgi:ParG